MQQSALRSLAIVCDRMETNLFAIVCDLRFAIRDRLRSYGNQPLGDEDEDEWMISDDKIMLRGLIQLSPESSEADIRRKLGEVTRVKFPTVTDSDFVFLRAIRRKL